jgi:hypothetical protein
VRRLRPLFSPTSNEFKPSTAQSTRPAPELATVNNNLLYAEATAVCNNLKDALPEDC